jgi:hypothetical protein
MLHVIPELPDPFLGVSIAYVEIAFGVSYYLSIMLMFFTIAVEPGIVPPKDYNPNN